MLRVFVVIVALLGMTSARGGQFGLAGTAEGSCAHFPPDTMCVAVLYSGEVEQGDTARLKGVMKRVVELLESGLGKRVRIGKVHFDSSGGDMFAAMRLGRLIRENLMTTQVTFDAKCYSACVLAYLGGVARIPVGSIGVHSFYSKAIAGASNYETASARYNEAADELEGYLRFMRISISLLDAMKGTPPNRLKILTLDEMERMGVIGIDPVYAQRTN